MGEMRFDGRVAIVTGAGGQPSLGRSFAHLLASRGAKVVVNDLGTGPDGRGVTRVFAENVAQEIRDLGGEAIADTHSVAEEDQANAIVQAALDQWGRLDILVNNAGVNHLAGFDEITSGDIEQIYRVQLFGNTWMTRAAWKPMRAAGYGRVVNITSGALLGQPYTSIYGAGKAGIYGLTRSLAVEGGPLGIKVNAVAPAAGTVAISHFNDPTDAFYQLAFSSLSPDLVAPTVALLAHEECPVTGRLIESMGGKMNEVYYGRTQGWTDREVTLESLRDHFSAVIDRDGAEAIPDPDPDLASVFEPKPYQPA